MYNVLHTLQTLNTFQGALSNAKLNYWILADKLELTTESSFSRKYMCKLFVRIYVTKWCYYEEDFRSNYFEYLIVKSTLQV